jgi:hypothetical protein
VLDRPSGTVPQDALAPYTRDAAVDRYLQIIEQA